MIDVAAKVRRMHISRDCSIPHSSSAEKQQFQGLVTFPMYPNGFHFC